MLTYIRKMRAALTALCAIVLAMVSCEEKPQDNYVSMEFLEANYYGDFYENGTEDLLISLYSPEMELDIEGKRVLGGTGAIVSLDFIASDVDDNLMLPVGEYRVDTTFAAGTLVGKYGLTGLLPMDQGSYAMFYKDGKEESMNYVVSGSASVERDGGIVTISVDVTLDDGSEMKWQYKGAAKVADKTETDPPAPNYTFDFESSTAVKDTFVFDQVELYNHGSENGGPDYIEGLLENSETKEFLMLELYAPAGTVSPVHSYKIGSTANEWTCMRSPGGDDYYDYPSFVGFNCDMDGYYNDVYYLRSGSVDVREDGITADAVSYFGSEIHIEYKGEVAFSEIPQYVSYRMGDARGERGRAACPAVKMRRMK